MKTTGKWAVVFGILSLLDVGNLVLFFNCWNLAVNFQSTPTGSDPLARAGGDFRNAGELSLDEDERLPGPVTLSFCDSD
jgi:hypothetical protein